MKLRKIRPDKKIPYKVHMYPTIPIIAILGGIFVVLSTLLSQPPNALLESITTLIGLPVYGYMKKKNLVSKKRIYSVKRLRLVIFFYINIVA